MSLPMTDYAPMTETAGRHKDPFFASTWASCAPGEDFRTIFMEPLLYELPHCIALDELFPCQGVPIAHVDCNEVEDSRENSNKFDPIHQGRVYEQFCTCCATSPAATPLSEPARNPTPIEIEDQQYMNQPCYAKLIYKALAGAPDKTMSLSSLYEWFKRQTNKTDNKAVRSWQNSIRHNLSRNPAFEKVICPSKGRFVWRLKEGVQECDFGSRQQRKRKSINKSTTKSDGMLV